MPSSTEGITKALTTGEAHAIIDAAIEAKKRGGWITPAQAYLAMYRPDLTRVEGAALYRAFCRNWIWDCGTAPRYEGFYVYELRDPRTNAVRYVGQTVDPKGRYSGHCSGTNTGNPELHAWVMDLRASGLKPQMVILERFAGREYPSGRWPSALMDEAERKWIAHYLAAGADLLNRLDRAGWGRPIRKKKAEHVN